MFINGNRFRAVYKERLVSEEGLRFLELTTGEWPYTAGYMKVDTANCKVASSPSCRWPRPTSESDSW
jgi:hypothetical protein